MATDNTVKVSSFSSDYACLLCDICGSDNIVETTQGFVCQTCGLELELQKLQYDRPYNGDIIQCTKGLGRTQIGTNRERFLSPFSQKLNRLNQQNYWDFYEEGVLERAKEEISKLFSRLKLEEFNDAKKMVYLKFKKVWPKLEPKTKYRNVERLTAILTYFCLKIHDISIRSSQIIINSILTKKEFNDFYQQVIRYFPRYKTRNRQKYILQLLDEVSWSFNLGSSFLCQSKIFLYKLWEGIKNTTDHVIVGVISSISILCSKTFKKKVRIDSICRHLGIRMSTVQGQVKKKIVTEYNIEGFVSLVKSAGVLQKAFETLSFIEKEIETAGEEEKIELVFGDDTDIFNSHDDLNSYFFAFTSGEDESTIVYAQVHHPLMNFKEPRKSLKEAQKFLSFEIIRYHKGKDPPERQL